MNPKLSRGPQIDTQELRSIDNIYAICKQASLRAYELRLGAAPKIRDHSDPFNGGVVTALLEIQNGL